jgi:hypothetical protein
MRVLTASAFLFAMLNPHLAQEAAAWERTASEMAGLANGTSLPPLASGLHYLMAWIATNFWVCRIGLFWSGCHSLIGFLGGLAYAFGVSAKLANAVINVVFAYIPIGSCTAGAVEFLRKQTKVTKVGQASSPSITAPASNPPPGTASFADAAYVRFLKIPCTACAGRIEFPTNFLGEQIPCPHCRAVITLQKPVNLKMTCATCEGHLEFPNYALGQKILCPHCQNDITLSKPF